jgi:hypothetical protein
MALASIFQPENFQSHSTRRDDGDRNSLSATTEIQRIREWRQQGEAEAAQQLRLKGVVCLPMFNNPVQDINTDAFWS